MSSISRITVKGIVSSYDIDGDIIQQQVYHSLEGREKIIQRYIQHHKIAYYQIFPKVEITKVGLDGKNIEEINAKGIYNKAQQEKRLKELQEESKERYKRPPSQYTNIPVYDYNKKSTN